QGKANYHGTLRERGIEAVNESRFHFDYGPLDGGDTIYMQQQDYPLDQVRHNKIVDAEQNPLPPANDDTAEQIEAANEEARQLRAELWQHKAIEATREAINA